MFESVISSRYVKSSFILTKFIIIDDQIDCYAGQVQYFFKHVVDFKDGPAEHNLAYIQWYKSVESFKVQYYFSIDNEEKTCNVELRKNEFSPDGRDSIIPV